VEVISVEYVVVDMSAVQINSVLLIANQSNLVFFSSNFAV